MARGLISKPKMLIIDETLHSLPLSQELKIIKDIIDKKSELKINTIVLVTASKSVLELADSAILLE